MKTTKTDEVKKELPDDGHRPWKCKKCTDYGLAGPNPSMTHWKFHRDPRAYGLASTRLASIELEVTCPMPHPKAQFSPAVMRAVARWGATRGDDTPSVYGFELCTAPASGMYFVQQALDYHRAFILDDIGVNTSAGGHVHVDTTDLCLDGLRRLLLLYWFVEPALYKMVPRYRKDHDEDHNWCQPLRSHYILRGLADDKKYEGALTSYTSRYSGLNLRARYKHNTVEFRMPPAMIDAKQMIGWARVLAGVVDFAAEHTIDEVLAVGGKNLVIQLSPSKSLRVLLEVMKCHGARRFCEEQSIVADDHWRKISSVDGACNALLPTRGTSSEFDSLRRRIKARVTRKEEEVA